MRVLATLALLVFLVSSLHAQPRRLGTSLRDQATVALRGGDTAAARALFEQWLAADPTDESSWYNLACVYALSGDTDAALDAFESSVEAGWRDAVHPTRDTDLDAIRSSPRFQTALERIRARAAANGPRDYIRRFAPMTSRGSYIVMLPPDYATTSREYPVCVILHGSGSSETAHGRIADTLGREGIIYVAPRAPHPHTGVVATGSLGWTAGTPDPLDESDPTRVLVQTDYVDWILSVVDDVQSNFRARKGKIYIYGHSQGGAYANMVALTHPDRVASYYAQAPSLPTDRFLNAANARRMKSEGVTAYLIHGEQDAVVPPSSSTAIERVLAEAGVERTLRMVPGDHGFNAAIYADIRAWVAKIRAAK